jgi:hypothetical protein
MSKKHPGAVALGKLGGKVKSAAKAEASRLNGAKGGRPPKETPKVRRGLPAHFGATS